jgi:A/G-specific adenine glycosylase
MGRLGYYARARNLHAAAQAIAAQGWPRDSAGWRALPGIGPYTAAALGAIALGEAVVPVDGNVERVVARVFAVEAPLPGAKGELARLAQGFAVQPAVRARPGDFAQALFDLGATICTPRRPACALCPWRPGCAGFARGIQDTLPRKPAKAAARLIFGTHFALTDPEGGCGSSAGRRAGCWAACSPCPARPGATRHGGRRRRWPMRRSRPVPSSPPGRCCPARRGTPSPTAR